MPTPAFGSGGSSQDRPYEDGSSADASRPTQPGGRLPEPQLLEQVIQQTLMLDQSSEAANQVQVQALREVAERHRGAAFTLDPVAVDLVKAVFSAHFSGPPGEAEPLETISRRVAETLYEDPVSHDRMAALWARLSEAK